MNISICCPSYKRPRVETLDYLPKTKVYVDKSEIEAYREANPEWARIIACEDGVQGNLCRVRNHILQREFEDPNVDAVVIVDDDMSAIYYWECDTESQTVNKVKLDGSEVERICDKYSRMCKELGFFYWGMNCNMDKMSYRQYSPFSFISYIGGPFQAFIRGNECYYDERLPLKEDYDMTLQQCQRYRGCLRCNFLTYDVKQSKQPGGCATYRTLNAEKEQLYELQKKWGDKIVRIDDGRSKGGVRRRSFDYNPIIRIPIKGI